MFSWSNRWVQPERQPQHSASTPRAYSSIAHATTAARQDSGKLAGRTGRVDCINNSGRHLHEGFDRTNIGTAVLDEAHEKGRSELSACRYIKLAGLEGWPPLYSEYSGGGGGGGGGV